MTTLPRCPQCALELTTPSLRDPTICILCAGGDHGALVPKQRAEILRLLADLGRIGALTKEASLDAEEKLAFIGEVVEGVPAKADNANATMADLTPAPAATPAT